MYNDLGEVGILSVGSTENDQVNTDVFGDIPSDCSSDYLIIVTNTDQQDNLAVGGFGKENVDLGAPGEQIQVAAPNNGYRKDSGTSFSAPHVTGAIGLIYSLEEATFCDNARISPTEAILSLKRYILDGVTLSESLKGKTVSGGRLNLGKTVDMVTSATVKKFEVIHTYPNPVHTSFYIDCENYGETINLMIRDVTGRIIHQESNLPNIENLIVVADSWPAGPYILQLQGKKLSGYQKIMKL
jgi:hypothetical protein